MYPLLAHFTLRSPSVAYCQRLGTRLAEPLPSLQLPSLFSFTLLLTQLTVFSGVNQKHDILAEEVKGVWVLFGRVLNSALLCVLVHPVLVQTR